MTEKKQRTVTWIYPSTIDRIDVLLQQTDCKTRSGLIEKAVNFYWSYLHQQECVDFLTPILSGTIKGTVQNSEDRLSRLLFKTAVELAKLTEIMAAVNRLDDSTMRKLHIRCVDEVRKINGVIRYEDAVKFQHGGGDGSCPG